MNTKLPSDHPWPKAMSPSDDEECERRLDKYMLFMSQTYSIPLDRADQDSFKAGFAAAVAFVRGSVA